MYLGDSGQYLGNLLEGIEGSLIEERQKSHSKNYIKLTKQYNELNRKYSIQFSEIDKNPNSIETKLAEISALHPNLNVELRLGGIGRILGKDQYKKIKNILLYIEYSDLSGYLKLILNECFVKLIPSGLTKGIAAELQFLGQILMYPDEQKRNLLSKIYSKNNLKSQIETGKFLVNLNLFFQFFPSGRVEVPKTKRGYNDKGSMSLESERERKIAMTEIEEEIDLKRQKIILKQLELFERNLDKLLEIETSDSSRKTIKNIIKNQNETLETNLTKFEEEYENVRKERKENYKYEQQNTASSRNGTKDQET